MCFLYYLRARSRSVPSELPFEPATHDQNASTYILRFYAAATIAAAAASVPFCLEVILYDQQVQGDSVSTINYEVVQRAPATTNCFDLKRTKNNFLGAKNSFKDLKIKKRSLRSTKYNISRFACFVKVKYFKVVPQLAQM